MPVSFSIALLISSLTERIYVNLQLGFKFRMQKLNSNDLKVPEKKFAGHVSGKKSGFLLLKLNCEKSFKFQLLLLFYICIYVFFLRRFMLFLRSPFFLFIFILTLLLGDKISRKDQCDTALIFAPLF